MAALCIFTVLAFIILVEFQLTPQESRVLVRHTDDYQQIFQLPENLNSLSRIKSLQRSHTDNPGNIDVASNLSREYLKLFQSTGNARFLGAAKNTLQEWQTSPAPPAAIWLIRSRIKQTEHLFSEAARDLNRYNQRYPGHIEALLLETDAWRRAGEIANAKKSCLQLALSRRTDLAIICSAEILLSTGQYNEALGLLESSNRSWSSAQADIALWSESIYADALYANGKIIEAAEVWKTLNDNHLLPLSYRLSYADILIELEDWEMVTKLFRKENLSTAAMLRVAMAARHTDQPLYRKLARQLRTKFDIIDKSGRTDIHLRELALYNFWIQPDLELAMMQALQNWELQKGWEDTHLVLTIAEQTSNAKARNRIIHWQNAVGGGTAL